MKRNILATLSLTVVVLAGSVLSAVASCPGSSSCSTKCKDCVTKITSALQKMDGIQNSGWDAKAKAFNVAFVPTKANTKAIAATITGAGYPAKLVTVGDYSGELCTPEMCKAMGQSCGVNDAKCNSKTMKSSAHKAKTTSGNSSL